MHVILWVGQDLLQLCLFFCLHCSHWVLSCSYHDDVVFGLSQVWLYRLWVIWRWDGRRHCRHLEEGCSICIGRACGGATSKALPSVSMMRWIVVSQCNTKYYYLKWTCTYICIIVGYVYVKLLQIAVWIDHWVSNKPSPDGHVEDIRLLYLYLSCRSLWFLHACIIYTRVIHAIIRG
jgi:hypothetical protein